jgi:hypothetical protein
MSGTVPGQELAWTLLPPAGTVGIIGFTMDKATVRLSNLMALDATAFGNWGCHRTIPAVDSSCERVQWPFVEFHESGRTGALRGVHGDRSRSGRAWSLETSNPPAD